VGDLILWGRARGRKKEFFLPLDPLHHLFLIHVPVLEPVRVRSLTSGDDTIRTGGS